jgi:hypothetical protein
VGYTLSTKTVFLLAKKNDAIFFPLFVFTAALDDEVDSWYHSYESEEG